MLTADLIEAIEALADTPYAATIGALSKTAALALQQALRVASGRPHDPEWREAHEQIGRAVAAAQALSNHRASRAIALCVAFLAENADLIDDKSVPASSSAR